MKKILSLVIIMVSVIIANAQNDTLFTRTEIYHPGDYSSTNYRIPAVITAKDGSIVAVTDKRKYNEGDLPQDIDIVCNRSTSPKAPASTTASATARWHGATMRTASSRSSWAAPDCGIRHHQNL